MQVVGFPWAKEPFARARDHTRVGDIDGGAQILAEKASLFISRKDRRVSAAPSPTLALVAADG
jgi:hypothetical protein